MLLIILLIIILIIIFASIIENKNDKVKLLKLENDRLKKRIIELQQYIDNSGENIEAGKVIELKTEVKKETINIQLPELAKELSPEEREKKRLQKEKEEREKKNTTILDIYGEVVVADSYQRNHMIVDFGKNRGQIEVPKSRFDVVFRK